MGKYSYFFAGALFQLAALDCTSVTQGLAFWGVGLIFWWASYFGAEEG